MSVATPRPLLSYVTDPETGKVYPVPAGGAEDAPEPAPADAPDEPDTGDEPEGDTPDPAAEAEKWKALARKHESQAKKNADAARRLAEIEESQKTEQQKLAEAKDAAAQEATEARAEATRLRMAIKYGLEEEDLDLLGTGPEEDIEARAERLAARIGAMTEPSDDKPGPSRRPQEKLRPGASTDSDPDPTDMNALLHAAVRGG